MRDHRSLQQVTEDGEDRMEVLKWPGFWREERREEGGREKKKREGRRKIDDHVHK